jgi:antitoxin MazE
MIRRLFRTGNSIVLSLPRDVLEGLNLSEGKNISLQLDSQNQRAIITPMEKPGAVAGITEDFARQVNDFIDQYRPALDELAK